MTAGCTGWGGCDIKGYRYLCGKKAWGISGHGGHTDDEDKEK